MARRPDRPARRRRVAGERAGDRLRRPAPPAESPFPLTPPVTTPDAGPEPPSPPQVRPGEERPDPADRPGRLRVPALSSGWTGSWRVVLAVLTAVVLALAVGSYFLQDSFHGKGETNADVDAGNAAAEAASKAIVDVLSYDYRTFDEDVAAGEAHLTGAFRDEYRATQMETVKRTARRFKATVEADVVAAGAIRAEGDRATVLVFVDQTATNSKLAAPRIDKNRVRLEMTKVDGRWLITELEPI